MLQSEVLIAELVAVDCLAASPISASEVSSLSHKPRDDPMKTATLKMQKILRLRRQPTLSCAQSPEVLCSPRHHMIEELHLQTPDVSAAYAQVEEHHWIGGHA